MNQDPFHSPEPPAEAAVPALPGRDWRVGHEGRDRMWYEERHAGEWRRLNIDGEMLTGRAHHVIYFDSAESWQRLPEWARHRREEIIRRIKIEFREPDYEYQGEDTPFPPPPPASVAQTPVAVVSVPLAPNPAPPAKKPESKLSGMLYSLIFIGAAAWLIWEVKTGLDTGAVRLTSRYAASGDPILCQEQPALFFVCIGFLAFMGLGSLGLGAIGFFSAMRSPK